MSIEIIVRIIGAVVFGLGGWRLGLRVAPVVGLEGWILELLVPVLIGAVIGVVLLPILTVYPLRWLQQRFAEMPTSTLTAGVGGLVIGLSIAALVSIPLFRLPNFLGIGIPLLLMAFLGFLGLFLGLSRDGDVRVLLPDDRESLALSRRQQILNGQIVVDTSAIIDGRIADLSQTGFVQGVLVIPRFVLDELRHVADSSDALRRARGRRGLEVLTRLREETDVPIRILDTDTRDSDEVDGKLVKLAKVIKGPILTTDYNLNRVAEIQGVKVLNVNELANALRPVVLPGEEMRVHILQDGKEVGQGVGYLDDGTMIVVEGGRRFMNDSIAVIVTRILQTAAGRIIFAQPKNH